ncbi:pantoate-beta-alanine ligase [Lodderomyces elongisporus]|uniref:pantoate-beta-alanine ligase n=1 Tax=Lodderomyces elongisporus TaxID=36914 RepID=UPI00291CA1EF|nr:pantoate-beta-alanine ligase [Lodderomyces elongisporus]WLF76408.1 pantoate-beta-alanine ligase [Lodderomyces elongisporus]
MTVSNKITILRTVQQVRQWRAQSFLNGQTVGFVPTMGALHAGHCSLVSQSLTENDKTIVSIFVNPSQFAPHEDLEAYPRTLDRDLEILESQFREKHVDAVFVPKISEMYPNGIVLDVSKQKGAFVTVHGSSEQLEGVTRPQFFRGVATVVTKLLNIVQPTRIYFGQKDAQQCVVIKNLVRDLIIDTEVRVMPTMRESNGLAMSSRNEYLSQEMKDRSSVIYKALKAGSAFYNENVAKEDKVSASELISTIKKVIEKEKAFEIEYIAVSHPDSLEDLEYVELGTGAVVSCAVKVPKENSTEKARLIDNIILD